MGKKRSKKSSGKPHANKSFDQLVGKANQEALKPYILQQMNQLGMQLQQNLMNQMSSVQMRIMAVEQFLIEKLNITEDDISNKIAELEDEATGFVESTEGAEEGNTLRATINVKPEGKDEFGPDQRMQLDKLAQEPYTVNENFEKQLLGIKKGETREVSLDEGKTQVKVKADKVSKPKPRPEAEKKEESNKEESNVSQDAQ